MKEIETLSKQIAELKMMIVNTTMKKVLTVEEAASYMGMSTEYLQKLCKARKIKSYRSKSGKKIYFHKSDLDDWMMYTEINTTDFIRAEAARIAARAN